MIRHFPTAGRLRYHRASFATHRAHDLYVRAGAPVYAVEPGVVLRRNLVEEGPGGLLVLQRADSGRLYWYSHLREPGRYPAGTRVWAGQLLGRVGRTGNAPGPLLHLQAVGRDGRALDVYDELRAVQVPRWAATHTERGALVVAPWVVQVVAANLLSSAAAWWMLRR